MKNTLSILAASLLLWFSSCKKEQDKKYAGPQFSLDKFDTELRASITPSGAIGWAYTINQNGLLVKSGAFGKSRNTADGNMSFSLNKKINIASVTKLFTAIAVVQLLESKNLSLNTPIADYLPPSWQKGPGVTGLTFGELLGHTSGLSSYNTQFSRTLSYTGLRLCIDTGVIRSQTYTYLNANFALCRILIPGLWRGMPGAPTISAALDSATTENNYIRYMQEKVFEPIGLTNINCIPEDRNIATMYYATTDLDNINGVAYTDWTAICGGGGFYMTTMELARFMAYLRHTSLILTGDQRKILTDGRYGMDTEDGAREVHGSYYGKNGSIANTAGRGTLEQVVMFPNGIEVVVVCNTQGMVFAGGTTSLQNAIYDAYNKAWN